MRHASLQGAMREIPVYVFGGDHGNLWVPRMDPRAFPLLRSETVLEGIARPALRVLFRFGTPTENE